MSKYTSTTVETSFLGHRTPKEVKLLVKALKTTQIAVIVKYIDAVVEFISRGKAPDFSKELDPSPSRVLFGGIHCILSRALRHGCKLQETHFINSLKETGLTDEVLSLLGEALYRGRELTSLTPDPSYSSKTFLDLDWRLDVVLSNHHLAKVLQPEILMDIKMGGGARDVHMQLSQPEFHALRQSVARQLHDMCQLRERKFMNPA